MEEREDGETRTYAIIGRWRHVLLLSAAEVGWGSGGRCWLVLTAGGGGGSAWLAVAAASSAAAAAATAAAGTESSLVLNTTTHAASFCFLAFYDNVLIALLCVACFAVMRWL